jgi:hypothetical protein
LQADTSSEGVQGLSEGTIMDVHAKIGAKYLKNKSQYLVTQLQIKPSTSEYNCRTIPLHQPA